MSGTILFVDDDRSWYETIDGILRDEGYEVIWVPSRVALQALLDANRKVDIAITNLNLKPNSLVLDGTGYIILEYLQKQWPQLPKIVISSLQELPNIDKPASGIKMAKKVIELYDRYKVDYVAIKGDVDANELVHKINGIISLKGSMKTMNWETIVTTVVSAITPYAVALGTSTVSAFGSKFGVAIYGNVQKIWGWIRQNIEGSGNEQDKQLWENFKNDPVSYRKQLADTLLRLVPVEDTEIRQNAHSLIQGLYILLDNYDNFTLTDLKRICSQLSVRWENEVPNPTTEAMARWAANYARTRRKEQDLVVAILEINPSALPT
jgi:CheY-like chemotaxis protein